MWATAMLFAKAKNVLLFHNCKECEIKRDGSVGHFIKEKLFHQILVDFSQRGKPPKHNKQTLHLSGPMHYMTIQNCIDFIDCNISTGLKRYGLADEWFKYFDDFAKKNDWSLRWNPQKALVIHVRLEDCAPEGDSFKDFPIKYIGDEKLQILIEHLNRQFPNHDIHLVTSPLDRDIERCKGLTQSYPYVKGVWGDESEDYALWQMMCSDILIFARSTFSILAGFLHQGSSCFAYEAFPNFKKFNGTDEYATWEVLDIPGI